MYIQVYEYSGENETQPNNNNNTLASVYIIPTYGSNFIPKSLLLLAAAAATSRTAHT